MDMRHLINPIDQSIQIALLIGVNFESIVTVSLYELLNDSSVAHQRALQKLGK